MKQYIVTFATGRIIRTWARSPRNAVFAAQLHYLDGEATAREVGDE